MTNTDHRQSQVSRSLSKVLRHQAETERIPISKDGWVKISDLLSWRGLGHRSISNPPVTLGEIMRVVEQDGIHGKGRFGLKLDMIHTKDYRLSIFMIDQLQEQNTYEQHAAGACKQPSLATDLKSKNSPETLSVIAYQAENPDVPASVYLIRATQGHSIKAVESEGLLTPITLEDPSSIPETVVHGTFYGAWMSILSTGGLKPMSRNMIHFASGPSLTAVLPSDLSNMTGQTSELKSKKQVDEVLLQSKVISGMRWDAQVLIYIDINRLLEDSRDNNWDMKWWRSDNGVILSEGVPRALVENMAENRYEGSVEVQPLGQETVANKSATNKLRGNAQVKDNLNVPLEMEQDKIVPMAYFDAVVEIKAGIGILWRAKEGVVRELPEHLRSKGIPRGKGHGATRNKAGRAKVRARVERDTELRAHFGHEDE